MKGKLVIEEKKVEREKVGKVAVDLMMKEPETTSPIEQMKESLTDYEKNVYECVDRCRKEFTGDFYVLVITKKERLLENVLRNYFYGRLSCPTPDWDQTVYKFKRKSNQLVFMWVIPSKQVCEHLTENSHYVVREEQGLLKYVMAFNNGTLLALAKELNGEKKQGVELENFTFKG